MGIFRGLFITSFVYCCLLYCKCISDVSSSPVCNLTTPSVAVHYPAMIFSVLVTSDVVCF